MSISTSLSFICTAQFFYCFFIKVRTAHIYSFIGPMCSYYCIDQFLNQLQKWILRILNLYEPDLLIFLSLLPLTKLTTVTNGAFTKNSHTQMKITQFRSMTGKLNSILVVTKHPPFDNKILMFMNSFYRCKPFLY